MDVNNVKDRLKGIGVRNGLTIIGFGVLLGLVVVLIQVVASILGMIPVIGSLFDLVAYVGTSLLFMCVVPLLYDYVLSICSGNQVGVIDCFKSLIFNSNNYISCMFYNLRATWWRMLVASLVGSIPIMFAFKSLLSGKIGTYILMLNISIIAIMLLSFLLCYKFMFIQIAKLYNSEWGYAECKSISISLTSSGPVAMLMTVLKSMGINILFFFIPVVNVLLAYPRMLAVPALLFLEGIDSVDADSIQTAAPQRESKRGGKQPKQSKRNRRDNQVEPERVPEMTEEEPVEEVVTVADDMIRAIRGAFVTKLTCNGQTRIALPIDIVTKAGITKYNFFVKEGDEVKAVQVNESSIESLLVLDRKFDPAQYVDWEPHWNVQRDWKLDN